LIQKKLRQENFHARRFDETIGRLSNAVFETMVCEADIDKLRFGEVKQILDGDELPAAPSNPK